MENNFKVNSEEAKGFIKNLFNLNVYFTPKIICIFYIICLISCALLFLAFLVMGIMAIFSGLILTGLINIIAGFLILFVYTIMIRINAELTMLAFKNNEYLKKISEK